MKTLMMLLLLMCLTGCVSSNKTHVMGTSINPVAIKPQIIESSANDSVIVQTVDTNGPIKMFMWIIGTVVVVCCGCVLIPRSSGPPRQSNPVQDSDERVVLND